MSVCSLTPAAMKQIDTICEENEVYAVTLNMKGGGCAGFEYQWGTYKSPSELLDDDEVFKTDKNYTFVIGSASLMFLFGTVIDYKKDMDKLSIPA